MVDEGRLFNGDRRYISCVERYGREDILEQVRSHLVMEFKPSAGWKEIIITEKYFICMATFVIAFEDLEFLDLAITLRKDRTQLTAFDRFGNMFKDIVYFPQTEHGKIRYEVASRTPGLLIGDTVENQLEYKRRHMDDFARIAREYMSQTKLYRYQNSYLYRDKSIGASIAFVLVFVVMFLRLFTVETVGQAIGVILLLLIFGTLAVFMIIHRKKTFGSYKAFVKEHEDEILDQINNKVVYTPSTNNRRSVFVTEKYLVLIGEAVWNREDVVWYHQYLYKGNMHFEAFNKKGEARSSISGNEQRDWDLDELIIGSLLPNAATGSINGARAYVEKFKNANK